MGGMTLALPESAPVAEFPPPRTMPHLGTGEANRLGDLHALQRRAATPGEAEAVRLLASVQAEAARVFDLPARKRSGPCLRITR